MSGKLDVFVIDTMQAMAFDRDGRSIAWYRRNRARSRALFDLVTEDAYYSRPIALRHPIVFYEGHLPAFSFNTLVKKGARRPGIDARLETLFARGIDPHEIGGGRRRPGGSPRSGLADARRGARVRRRSRSPGDRRARARGPRAAGPSAARSRRSGVHHPRARGDAPGDAALHVASAAVRRRSASRPATRRATDGAPPPQRVDRRSRRAARRSASIAATCRSAGTTSSRRCAPTCRRSRSSATTSPTRAFSSSSTPAAIAIRAGGAPRTGTGCSASGVAHPLFWERARRSLVLARDVRAVAAAAGVAGLRQPGRSLGVRALARRAPADRSGVPARGLRHRRERRAAASVGRRRRRRPRTACSISRAGIPSRPAAIRRARSAWGVEDLVGNGWEWTSTPFAPFPGFRADGVVSGVLGRLLRRRALRDEGRVAGDRPRAAAADVPQLVPRRAIPYVYATFRCVRDHATAEPPTRDRRAFAADVAVLPARCTPRQLPSRYLYDALGSALFEAICRAAVVPASRAPRRGCSTRTRREIFARVARLSTHRRARAGQRREAGDAGRARRAARPRRSTCTWSTSRRRRSSWRARALGALDRRRRRDAPGAVRRRAARGAARERAGGRTLVLFLGSNIGNFDPPGADAFLRGIRAALAPGDALLLGADLVKPERDLLLAYDDPLGVTAAFNRNLLRPHQPRARRRLRPRRLRASRGVERRGVAGRDAPGQPRRAARAHPGAPTSTSRSTKARRSGPRARTSTSRRSHRGCSARRLPPRRAVDRPTRERFALTLVER